MNTTSTTETTKAKIVIERQYDARPEEIWDLWTTKEGFESWWGPQGFRVEVHTLEARVGGALHYDMIAATPENVEAMRRIGQPAKHETRGRFAIVDPHRRLAITHVIDFVLGVPSYENTLLVELFPSGTATRMVVTLEPMHSDQFSQMQKEGFTSQLTKLDDRFRG